MSISERAVAQIGKRPRPSKICPQCGREFDKPMGWSASSWTAVTRCSQYCRTQAIRGRIYRPIRQRIIDKVTFEPNSGCWLWTGGVSSYGYAASQIKGRQVLMHRIVFEMHKGSVPKDGILSHLCNVRCCVNPDHIELWRESSNRNESVQGGVVEAREIKPRSSIQHRRFFGLVSALYSHWPERYISVVMKTGHRLAVVPTIGVPRADRCHQTEQAILKTDATAQVWLLYDDRGVLETWIAHLDWLNAHLPVASVQVTQCVAKLREVAS